MKSKKLLALVLGATLIVSTAMVGCEKKKPGENKPGEQQADQKVKMDKDQYLNLYMGIEPKTLDISRSTDVYSSMVFAETGEGLTRIEQDKDGKDVIKEAGAEKWEHNEDGTVWTFHLRDYNWSDGKPVTAKDFEYSIKRTLEPKTGSTYAFLLAPIKNASEFNKGKATRDQVGIKAIDDKTLEFTLKQPCPYFLNLTYFKLFMPQRQDIVEKHGEKYGSDLETLEVFCGPFTISKWTHQHEIVLQKNDKYWDKDKVKLQNVTYKIIKDPTAAYNSLYTGQLDSMKVKKPEWINKFKKSGKFDNIKTFEPSVAYMFFNQKNKLFTNPNVRKAFSTAFTREDYAKVITYDRDVAAYGWCPPTVQINEKDFREDPNEGPLKKLIDENKDPKALLMKGLKELGMDEDPSKVTVTISYGDTDPETRRLAEYEQQMFQKALGVKIKAEYSDWGVFLEKVDHGQYEIAGMGWTGDYNDPNTFFDMWMEGANIVPTGWSNKEYDDQVKKAMSSIDPAERIAAYKEAERILVYEEAPMFPTTYRRKNIFKRKFVKNMITPLFGAEYEFKYAYTEGRSK